ncbi:hypothetical protein MXD58_005795 [Frankia sp. AgKG'84/4]|nr:hypothetical protein [Frankia sp. AgKG'84/4]
MPCRTWGNRVKVNLEQVLQWVAKVLNPSLFADVDLRKVTSSFYKTYFGHEPTADELTQILQTTSADGIATPANAVK